MKKYSQLIESIQYEQGSATLEVTEDWLQGRSMFGGLQAALGLCAMRQLVAEEFPLRTFQVTFMAPIPAGSVNAKAKLLRQGKNTFHVEASIADGDNTQALFVGVFGKGRKSTINRQLHQPEVDRSTLKPFLFEEGNTPNFTRHFTANWLKGDLPFAGSDNPEAIVEVSMHDRGTTSEAHLLAIADFIPPVGLSLLDSPAPGSSLTWMIEILAHHYQSQPLERWRVDAEMTAAGEGYTSQTATIYSPDGTAVALSRQSMVIFA